ncbi:AraC family transcriptional regulator [Paenibacillus xylanivorans]|uniref:HTH araC/xylS-type domain-containing protein n=1 Tax=Paenibacillus xylanivorans TaxID=1705561 RepID=A0A0N0C2C5_9BACL|nr:AraC family transcriptional regulator [Paenibacillus xylanivorans]KOY12614.1 hypothetical protein AMS66_29840 [Paenibacillus xylanivorans]
MVKRTVRLFSGTNYFNDITSIFINRSIESYEVIEHYHDFLELTYVCEGIGTHHINNEVIRVTKGDFFLIPVGASHVFRPGSISKEKQLVVYNCIMPLEFALQMLQAVPGGKELWHLLAPSEIWHLRDLNGEVHSLFERLYREFSIKRIGRDVALHASVLQLLTYIARLKTEDETISIQNGMDYILAILHSEYDKTITLQELASELGVGERQFQRLFLKYTGMTFLNYLQQIRIDAACRLLRTTNYKVSYVASSVGYNNIAFFNQLFKKKVGLAPREYKQLNK